MMKVLATQFRKRVNRFLSVALCILLAVCYCVPVQAAEETGNPTEITNVTTGTYEEDGVTYCTVDFDVLPGDGYCDTLPEIMPYSYDDHTYLVINNAYNTQQIYLAGSYLGYEMTATKNDGTCISDEVCVQLRNNVTSYASREDTITANGSTTKIDNVPINQNASYYYFRIIPLTSERLHVRIVVYSWQHLFLLHTKKK